MAIETIDEFRRRAGEFVRETAARIDAAIDERMTKFREELIARGVPAHRVSDYMAEARVRMLGERLKAVAEIDAEVRELLAGVGLR